MKRLIGFFAILFAVLILAGFSILKPEAKDAPIQFKGYAKYQNGNPAISGTLVKAYSGNTEKGRTQITLSTGYYELTGNPNDFPTGTYRLVADDGSLIGEINIPHTYNTETSCPDIVMNTAY